MTKNNLPDPGYQSSDVPIYQNQKLDQMHVGVYYLKSELQFLEAAIEARNRWHNALGSFLSCFAAFGSFLFISPMPVWLVVFWAGTSGLTLAWTLEAIRAARKHKDITLDSFIEKIKGEQA